MTQAAASGGIRPGDLALAVGSALVAAILSGTILVFTLDIPLSSPWAWLGAAFVLAALLAGLSYRHVGAMTAAGAVLAGLGISQLFTLQIALLEFEAVGRAFGRYSVQPPILLLLLGCALLGAGLGWTLLRSRAASSWSHYGVARMVGALVIGVPVGLYAAAAIENVRLEGDSMPLPALMVCVGAGLALGLLPSLSPTGLVPVLVILAVQVLWLGGRGVNLWVMAWIVLLSVLAHFVGPVARSRADVPSSAAD